MKAALLEGIEKLTIVNREVPKCKYGEVLVKVNACGICRTDMKAFYMGQRDLRLPRVLGHEIAGVVVESGEGVTQVKPGDRVQVAPGLPCGKCQYCLDGQQHMCDSVQIMGFHYDGGFAEYVLVPVNGVFSGVLNKIPEHLTYEEAALTEPLACCVNMHEKVKTGLGDTVVIFGSGPLGIINAKMSRARGAKAVILVEINKARLALAEKWGFDYCIDGTEEEAIKKVLEITGGKGADVVIPCCPSPKAFQEGIAMLGKSGRFGFFSGLVRDPQPIEVDLNIIHYRELTVVGAYGCSGNHNRKALEIMAQGLVTVKELITARISIDEVLEGIKMITRSEGIKSVIVSN